MRNSALIALCYLTLIFAQNVNANAQFDEFVVHVIPKCGTHFTHGTIQLLTGTPLGSSATSLNGIQQAELSGFPVRIFGSYDPLIHNYLKQKKIKLITVYRDPRDALISHLFYMRSYYEKNPSVGRKRDFFKVSANFDQLSFDDQLSALITGTQDMMSYLDFYHDRIQWTLSGKCLGLKYEDLVGEQGGGSNKKQADAIVRLANYINLELRQDRLEYVLANMYSKKEDVQQEDKTFVRASIGNWKTFLTPYHKLLFKNKLGKVLVKLGYEKNEKW